jgi:bifunctional non-homologous end joining protein LigD
MTLGIVWHIHCTFTSMLRTHAGAAVGRGASADRPLVAGVGISHPDRVVFPAIGATKLDLARYYEAIADWVVPQLVDRPLTLVRCPDGARGSGPRDAGCFYMKHSKVWAPLPVRRVRIQEKTKLGEYLIADTIQALVGLVQMGVLEVHTWNCRYARVEQPDRIVVDIDPGEAVDWPAVVAAARSVRELLHALDLDSFVKTTGGRGLHVVMPLTPAADWSDCLDFARAIAETLERRDPGQFTTRFAKLGRENKILIDYLRNNRTNTSIAAFSTRARPNAPVSMPLTWSELSPSRPPDRFTLETVPARLARLRTDPWEGYDNVRQKIPRGAVAALDRL